MNIDLYEQQLKYCSGTTSWQAIGLNDLEQNLLANPTRIKLKLLGRWRSDSFDFLWDGFISLPSQIKEATAVIDAAEVASRFTTADLYELVHYSKVNDLDISGAKITDNLLLALYSLKKLEVLNLSRCKGHINRFSNKIFRNLKKISFENSLIADDTFLNIDGQFIIDLNLVNTRLSEKGYNHLSTFHNLQSLALSGNHWRRSLIGEMHGLKQLSLISCECNDLSLRSLDCLNSLALWRCKIPPDWFSSINLTSLKRLDVSETAISSQAVMHIEGLVNLSSIRLNSINITNNLLSYVMQLPALEDINIDECVEINDLLQHAPCSSRLRSLSAANTNLSNKTVASVLRSPNLNFLDISRTQVTDECLQFRSECNLRALYLTETIISDNGLERLTELKCLETIDLKGTKITDKSCMVIRAIPRLTELCLMDTAITDFGIRFISEMVDLERLYLSNTKITDVGLVLISKLSKLRTLWIMECNVSSDAIRQLQEAIPYCCISQ